MTNRGNGPSLVPVPGGVCHDLIRWLSKEGQEDRVSAIGEGRGLSIQFLLVLVNREVKCGTTVQLP